MDQPIFQDAVALVEFPLPDLVLGGGGGGEYLDDPVRGAAAALFIELGGVADDRDVGLNNRLYGLVGLVLVRQTDIEGGDVDPAAVTLEMIADLAHQFDYHVLMDPGGGGGHGVGLAVDQFPAFLIGPGAIVRVGEVVRFVSWLCHAECLRVLVG